MSDRTLLIVKPSESTVDPDHTVLNKTYLLSEIAKLNNELEKISDESYDEVIITELTPGENELSQIFRILKSKGKFLIDGITDRELGQQIALDLKIQGFFDIMAAKDPSTGRRFIISQRPVRENVGVVKINLNEDAPATTTSNGWKIDLNNDDDGEVIDEDALLAEIPVEKVDNGEDEGCGGPKRKPCANCTCGLADKEGEKKPLTEDQKVEKANSCGNCYKGDAFRCASCPFLGKPAFEPGQEKLILALDSDL